MAAESRATYTTAKELESAIAKEREMMEVAARDLDFTTAALHRDRMYALMDQLNRQKK